MSYDLIEITLIRLGEQLPDRLSPSYQSRETYLSTFRGRDPLAQKDRPLKEQLIEAPKLAPHLPNHCNKSR
jgi:hypothetical protein